MANLKGSTASFLSDIHPIFKGIIAVAVTGTIIFVGYKVYKKFNVSQQDKDAIKRKEEEDKLVQSEIKKNEIKASLSYPASSYIDYANQIYDALNGCAFLGFEKVKTISMKMKNNLDVATLIKAYGNRQRTCLKIDIGGNDSLLTTIRVSCEVNCGFIDEINNDWSNKRITYRI